MNTLYSSKHALTITADLMLHPPFFEETKKTEITEFNKQTATIKKEKQTKKRKHEIMLQREQCVLS